MSDTSIQEQVAQAIEGRATPNNPAFVQGMRTAACIVREFEPPVSADAGLREAIKALVREWMPPEMCENFGVPYDCITQSKTLPCFNCRMRLEFDAALAAHPAPPVTVTDAMVERADASIGWIEMDKRYGRAIDWPDYIRREMLHAALTAALTEGGAE